jgi:hypothetical protein
LPAKVGAPGEWLNGSKCLCPGLLQLHAQFGGALQVDVFDGKRVAAGIELDSGLRSAASFAFDDEDEFVVYKQASAIVCSQSKDEA